MDELKVFVGTLFVLNISAWVLDNRLNERTRTQGQRQWWSKLSERSWSRLLDDSNAEFAELFDYLYGKKTISWKRFWRSFVCSIFAVAAVTIICGCVTPLSETIAKGNTYFNFYNTVIMILVVNPVVDFISLIETRLVLGLAINRPSLVKVVLCFALDIFLTYVLIWVGVVIFVLLIDPGSLDFVALSMNFFSGEGIWDVAGYGLFAISTYFTSAMLVVFVISAILAKSMYLVFARTDHFFQLLAATGHPAQIVAGGASGFIVLGYAVYFAIAQI